MAVLTTTLSEPERRARRDAATARVETLSERPSSEFPFAGLPGDQRRLLTPPDGAPVVPFE